MKLCAPVIPFMTERIFQNLYEPEALATVPSVHLCVYPNADETLVDHELSDEMDAVLHLVSLGGSVRETIKINKRKPLAELTIQPADEIERKGGASIRGPDLCRIERQKIDAAQSASETAAFV